MPVVREACAIREVEVMNAKMEKKCVGGDERTRSECLIFIQSYFFQC